MTVLVTHDNKTLDLKQWASILGIDYDTLRRRYKRGKRGEDLFCSYVPNTFKKRIVRFVPKRPPNVPSDGTK